MPAHLVWATLNYRIASAHRAAVVQRYQYLKFPTLNLKNL